MPVPDATSEARRVLEICNACRYCEGFCAVFPAMERRREFSVGDLKYLSNLCHDCRGCYYACQYAPPHEFAVNVPRSLAALRAETYVEYAWPRPLAVLFARNGTGLSLGVALGIAVVLLVAVYLGAPGGLTRRELGTGSFYRVIPENVMIVVGAVTLL